MAERDSCTPSRTRAHRAQFSLRSKDRRQRIIDIASKCTKDEWPISSRIASVDHYFTNSNDVRRCVDCLSNRKNNTQINGGPFRPIQFTRSEGFELCSKLPKAQPLTLITFESSFNLCAFSRLFSERKLNENPFDGNPRSNDVGPVCDSKNRVRLCSEKEVALNWRGENGHKDRKHSPYGRPSVPINHASFTKPPTLTHSVEKAHSPIPLRTVRHSATAEHRWETAHG